MILKNSIKYNCIGIVLCIFLFNKNNVYSQEMLWQLPNLDKKQFHWGFYLGSQLANYKLKYNAFNDMSASILNKTSIGFHLGLVADWRLYKYLNIRLEPGFISQSNVLEFTHSNLIKSVPIKKPDGTTENTYVPLDRGIQANYVYLPLILKFSGMRFDNVKPYGLAGMAYAFDFSSNESSEKDNYEEVFRSTMHNFMYEFGGGLDIYFPHFKFSPSIRAIFTINNQMVQDNISDSDYTAPIESFKMSGVFFRFTFE